MFITFHLEPNESTRTKERGCQYTATAEIDGRVYTTSSRSGAAARLARLLVAENIADCPVRVIDRRLKGSLEYPSLHKLAEYTYGEGRTTPLHRTKWRDISGVWPAEQAAD